MRRYARIQGGLVAELFETEANITTLFNPALVWVEVPERLAVAEGWNFNAGEFTKPAAPPPPATPTLADLQAQLDHLSARIAIILSGNTSTI